MKHFLLLFIGWVIINSSTLGQANQQTEAKAAYLLAEDEFNAGKYKEAIDYLDIAISKLGFANAKILYLKIISIQNLAVKNEQYVISLMKSIEEFEKTPDYNVFNEEKVLEIMKLKLKYKSVNDQLLAREAALLQKKKIDEAYAVDGAKRFKSFNITDLPLGIHEDELTSIYKKDPFFKEIVYTTKKRTKGLKGFYHAGNNHDASPLRCIFFYNDTVIGYRKTLHYFDPKKNSPVTSKEELQNLFEVTKANLEKEFGTQPIERIPVNYPNAFETLSKEYLWSFEGKHVSLIYSPGSYQTRNYAILIQVLMNRTLDQNTIQ